jgi:hypothetical protein
MIKQWNGALWKISMTKNYLRLERFSQDRSKSDFPYSVVEAEPCKLITEPDYNPTESEGNNTIHKRSGQISFIVSNMVELYKLICEIVEHGEDV